MILLDGNATSATIKGELKERVAKWVGEGNRAPHLAAILVGDNPASQAYVGGKIRDCKEVGFDSTLVELDEFVTKEELLAEVNKLNDDAGIDGYIVQLPLPAHIDETEIISHIKPEKDVDGFHPVSIGKMTLGLPTYLPATPYGIMELLKRYNIITEGKQVVVIGRSNIVGRPMSILLSRKNEIGNATVTLVHSRSKYINEHCSHADIIITAMGRPGFLTADMVKPGATIIDVGITRIDDASKKRGYRLTGDVDFESVKKVAGYITPVPGGVGPMTRVALLLNTFRAAKRGV